MKFTFKLALLVSFFCAFTSISAKDVKPPFTDYCKYLERDINGEQYGFLAGNKIYYVAGSGGADYRNIFELETLGFTHPMFRDGRARGFGIADATKAGIEGGVGHDCWGWEFWRHAKVAYGTLIVDGKRYKHPEPSKHYWRPDRLILEYNIAGVTIKEEKFISENDVLSTIITSDKPVKIEFQGESYNNPGMVATFDGDKAGMKMTVSSDSEVAFDKKQNAVVLLEKGKTKTKLKWGEPVVDGDMMYNNLNIVLASNQPIHGFSNEELPAGNVEYKFTIEVPANKNVVLSYAVNENSKEAIKRIKKDQKNIEKTRDAKTAYINTLLNEQIPYFRCSDDNANKSYYFLWSIYFMYFTDLKNGWEQYPHTQTAINNFMGLHLWDSWAYSAAGSWVADKWKWGFGNALSWQFMVPYKGDNNYLPDNFGTTWYSPKVKMNFQGAVEPIWQMYEQSGDKKYLAEVYNKLLRPLYIDNNNKGLSVNSGQALLKFAEELELKEDAKIWKAYVANKSEWFPNHRWTWLMNQYKNNKDYWKDIWDLADLQNNAISSELAKPFIEDYVLNTEHGFISPVGLNTRAADTPPNGIFRSSTISCWLAIDGLFRKDAAYAANLVTLNHLNAMVREYNYPIAPEAWDDKYQGWGSRYYNWDIAIVMPMIEWQGGVDYSLLENSFTFKPHLPDTWDYIQMYVPIVKEGKTQWVDAKVERVKKGKNYELVHTVKGNPLEKLTIAPYAQQRAVLNKKSSLKEKKIGGKSFYTAKTNSAEVTWKLGAKEVSNKTLVWMTPRTNQILGKGIINAENIIPGTELRYTTDGSIPTKKSKLFNSKITIDKSTTFTIKAFGNDTDYKPYVTTYELVESSPAINVTAPLKDGLHYNYYDLAENVKQLPDFTALQVVNKGEVFVEDFIPQLDFSALGLEGKEHFALKLSGYLSIDKEAIYNFNLLSDDGAMLYIDGKEVIKLNSVSSVDPWSFDGSIALAKGLHKIEVYYTQYTKKSKLSLTYKILGGDKFKHLPKESLKH